MALIVTACCMAIKAQAMAVAVGAQGYSVQRVQQICAAVANTTDFVKGLQQPFKTVN